jgi:sigma-B regulation protein RsbU (phosphoserine phosphatase)
MLDVPMRSIRAKLVLALGIPLLAVYLVLVWCEYQIGRQRALADMKTHLAELAGRQAAELDGELAEAEQLARTLARVMTSAQGFSAEQVRALLREHLAGNPKLFGMCAAFEENAFSPDIKTLAPYYCRDGAGLRYVDIAAATPDFRNRDWYALAKKTGRPTWTEPYFDTGVGERMMCTFSVPLLRQGRFLGVLTVDVLSEDLLQDIARIRIGSGYCALVSQKGTFISHPDPALVMRESMFTLAERCALDDLALAGEEMVAGRAGVRRIRDYSTGEPEWMVYAPVESAGWSLAAIIPESEIMAPIHARLARFLGGLIAGVAVMLGIILLVSRQVTRPIARLAAAAQSLAQGNLDARVPDVRGNDEIGRLARVFNEMVADLRANVERRIQEEAARKEVEGELTAAREIQASLLPAMLPDDEQDGFELHAVNAPARLVAGDFFDFFYVDRHRLALVMADVSGKGVPAAMYMAVTRTRLRDFATADKTPAQVVAEVNRSLARENDRGMFVTLFLGYYDIVTGELDYVNAGHNPPYLLRQRGGLEPIEPTGPLVAPFANAEFRTSRLHLDEGDLLFLFTDGITEAGPPGGDLFTEQRLERLVESLSSAPVATVCSNVIQAASDFSRGELPDDATVLALRRTVRQRRVALRVEGVCLQAAVGQSAAPDL